MMLALGIFTLIASLVITNIDTILSSTNEQSLQQIIKSAVRESRYLAAIHKRPTYLGFNYEIKKLFITDVDGQILDDFDCNYKEKCVSYLAIKSHSGRSRFQLCTQLIKSQGHHLRMFAFKLLRQPFVFLL